MAYISITRLHPRSVRYLPPFLWYVLRTSRQVQRAAGFRGGKLLRDEHGAYWTMTVWDDETAMRAYRQSGSHRAAMPHLIRWCDEASLAHWEQADPTLPSWNDAHQHMVQHGRRSRVEQPSAAHTAYMIAQPQRTYDLTLQPK